MQAVLAVLVLVLATLLFSAPATKIFPKAASGGCKGGQYIDPIPKESPEHYLFPLPQSYHFGQNNISISPHTFKIVSNLKSAFIDQIVERYERLMFPFHVNSTKGSLIRLELTVQSLNDSLQYGVDESYALSIDAPTSYLKASTVFGILRGIETFSQLIKFDDDSDSYEIQNTPWTIQDYPRFLHRGLLIDTSRHYLPVSTIFNVLDAMSYNKLNVLHWHIVDAQSFPIETSTYPNLIKGAYSKHEVYTKKNLADVIQHAFHRGIRVIPEFDSPGHTASWGEGYPDITVCRDKTRENGYCAENPCGEFDPSNSLTYEVVSSVYNEMAEIFPDQFFHLGGDEIKFNCWTDTPHVLQWMNKNGFNSSQTLQYYITKARSDAKNLDSKKTMYWQEIFNNGITVRNDSIFQVWLDFASLALVANSGYDVILSNWDAWYLDCGYGNWCPYCSYIDVFLNEPLDGNFTEEGKKRVLGGEVCMWGELVDETNAQQRIWPRASSGAERLWSNKDERNVGQHFARLLKQRCRMVMRGIPVEPLIPGSDSFTCHNIQE